MRKVTLKEAVEELGLGRTLIKAPTAKTTYLIDRKIEINGVWTACSAQRVRKDGSYSTRTAFKIDETFYIVEE